MENGKRKNIKNGNMERMETMETWKNGNIEN